MPNGSAARSHRCIASLLLFLLAAAWVLLAGAAGLPQSAQQSGLVMDTQTLPDTTLYRHPDSGLVRSLIGNFSFYGVKGTPEQIARLFLSDYSDVLAVPADTHDLVFDQVVEGEALRHVRFHQDYLGVPLWRDSVVVHMTKDQVILKVDSAYLPSIGLPSLAPKLSADDAASQAKAVTAPSGDPFALSSAVALAPQLFV